jgi:hypothetical protein
MKTNPVATTPCLWLSARAYSGGGVMFERGVVLGVAAILLSGCAGVTGPDYAGLVQKVGPPRPGQSRIVVLQEKASGLADSPCDVKIDGSPVGMLKLGTYVYVDRPAGHHQLLATQTLFPGDSKRDIKTESGRTYFFLARTSDRAKAVVGMTFVGGLAGALVASAVTSGNENPGPVDIFPLDEATARTTLAELKLAE